MPIDKAAELDPVVRPGAVETLRPTWPPAFEASETLIHVTSLLRREGMATEPAGLIGRSGRLDTSGIQFEAFRKDPLDAATLRCLRYMHDVEGHTMCYLRDILVTKVHKDPVLTAFLASWAYEEHWHSDAIARVLDAHGEPSGSSRLAELRRRISRRDDLRPLAFSAGSVFTRNLPAVHMAWGAVNEWSTQAAYARLVAKAHHHELSDLLRRIMKQEGRHIDFYAGEARRRLADHPRAQRFARFALRHFWSPVGASVMPDAEVRFVAMHLFGDAAGLEAARRVDRNIDRLPGLTGLRLLERAANERQQA